MAQLQRKTFERPAEVRDVPKARLDVVELGDVAVGRMVMQPGWRWSVDVKPIAGTPTCTYHHLGYCLEGILRTEMDDGTMIDIRAGDAYEVPPGHDAWVVGDEPFVGIDFAGVRTWGRSPDAIGERVLATILFTDIVDSTRLATAMGEDRWRTTLSQINESAQHEVDRYRGRLIKSTGDGILALFDGPGRAVRAAAKMTVAARAIGLEIRAGAHTGEVELMAGDVRGVAAHVAARVTSVAGPGEVLVSALTRDLVADPDLAFEDAGLHELKGLAEPLRLFRLTPRPA